jgi:uncharacterized protein YdiU (UPF0061 family)
VFAILYLMTKQVVTNTNTLNENDYSCFDEVNGLHPFKKACPGSYIDYEARYRKGGKLAYFNFHLAKEMGLIAKDHPEVVTKELTQKFLDTFSLIIINEFDQINNRKFPKDEIKPHKYMATKYLQLQHPNKKGTTSGDGRSIWNGVFKRNGRTWDISSCGTGATCLSPATAIANKYFESGDPTISYGCGYSEIDEGISTLMFSEVFHRNNIKTERVLGVIEFSKGIAINVRAHENLLRPSHFFNHLKQSNYESLKSVTDYYIQRQKANKLWRDVPAEDSAKYNYMLQKVTETFAKLSADFEDRYIFCWLDWDGDNILMDGSIIDYGSVRQFGLFHHEYRYDDVDRYSTTILEQKQKAKYIVQTFAQVIDYLIKGKKKALSEFATQKWSDQFEEIFQKQKRYNLVYQIGFSPDQCHYLLENKQELVDNFSKPFNYFERSKSKQGLTKVEDGINWSAIYCMRDILREFPQILLARETGLEPDEFIEIIRSNYATQEDLEPNAYRNKMIAQFQSAYIKLVEVIGKKERLGLRQTLLNITLRSSVINKYDRVTGDSITTIVHKMISYRPRLKPEEIHQMAQDFSEYQLLDPDKLNVRKTAGLTKNKLMRSLLRIVRDYREGL